MLEIGTFEGYTTLGLALNNPEAKIYTIDICREMKIDVPNYQRFGVLPKAQVGRAFGDKSENIFQIVYEYNKGVLMGCSENLGIFFGACA